MLRRDFLHFGAVSILAATLPLPVMASTPAFDYGSVPIDKLEEIEQAFDVMEVYGFSLSQKVALFGLVPDRVKTLAELRDRIQHFVIYWGCIDVRDRIGYLISIRRKLDERFGRDNLAAQLSFLDEPDTLLYSQSLREKMNMDNYNGLYTVAHVLENDVA